MQAKKSGLEGKELRDWATEQLHQYKENKREEAEKAERLRKEEKEEAERLRIELERSKEEERKEAERVHKRELELIEAKLELARLESNKGEGSQNNDSKSDKHAPRAPLFKFTHFNDKTDDLDSFFDVFEIQCKAFGVKDTDKVSHLLGLVSGKYRDTLTRMDTDLTYSQVRDKMLRTYSLTTNGYRERFFSLTPTTGETMTAFVQRLQACFDKWVSLAKITKDFTSLRDLIITHQISETCNPDLIKFLLERDINDVTSVIDKADSFFQAHSEKQLAKPTNAYSVNAAKYEDGQNTQYQSGTGRGSTRSRSNRGGYSFGGPRGRGNGNWRNNNTGRDGISCYYCQEKGHRKSDCPKKLFEELPKKLLEDLAKLNNQDPCAYCGKPGHKMGNCFKLQKEEKYYGIR